jgi:uncharacterized protein (UPF0335 family)
MTDPKLKSLVERIERLMDERDGIASDIRDIYSEAKGVGYVPKVLRKVIARARADQTKLAEEETLQDLYEAALDGPTRKALTMAASGATAREIESATGIDHVTVSRSVSLVKHEKKAGEPTSVCDGGAPVETSTVGPAVTTRDVVDIAADILALPPQHAAVVIDVVQALADDDPGPIPSFLKRTGQA